MNDTTTPASPTTRLAVTHEEISRQAQALWEKYGRPSGRDEEIWLEAERQLQMQRETIEQPAALSAPSTPATPPSAATRAARPSTATATPRMPGSRGRKQN